MNNKFYLGLGSNIGNNELNLKKAIKKLAENGIKLIKSSSLYVTKAQYYENQDDFLNQVIEVKTKLSPFELLDTIEKIMSEMKRKRLIKYGPRIIDIDILFYKNIEINKKILTIPHKLMFERDFILKPLYELNKKINIKNKPIKHWINLLKLYSKQIKIMGVLNVTSNSFSDGGKFDNLETGIKQFKKLSKYSDIIDIGAESSRPGSLAISEKEELNKVIPLIKKIRKLNKEILISIDTKKSNVAKQALTAGADIINDITGMKNKQLRKVASDFNCPTIIMHMKGIPQTMQKNLKTNLDIIKEINDFFKNQIKICVADGIKKENIFIDPGIGFGKTFKDNITIIKNLDKFNIHNSQILIGLSKKSFFQKITNTLVSQRQEETLTANLISIQNGAKLIRVHDVKSHYKMLKVYNKLKN
ncbi:MAG: dihydropteroate synthase [Nanoarchaeales archaeon]|nr:dihydropteroate synthase [Nanoarchaeales archaeon]